MFTRAAAAFKRGLVAVPPSVKVRQTRQGREIEVYRKGEGAWAMHACTHTYVHRLCVGVLEIGVWCG